MAIANRIEKDLEESLLQGLIPMQLVDQPLEQFWIKLIALALD